MSWLFWQNNRKAGTNPTKGQVKLSQKLLDSDIPWKYVCKIEFIAFLIKGDRTARWIIDSKDPEYCTRHEANAVSKKLIWLMLLSRKKPKIESELRKLLVCKETNGCKLLEGHQGSCRINGTEFAESTKCQLCGRKITYEDFERDARKDPQGISAAHRTPLSRITRGHNARNIAWAHRVCNQIQGEQTLDETLERMRDILESHGFNVTRR